MNQTATGVWRATRADLETEGGRGLLIVDQLTSHWGVHHPRKGGKVVWCVLER